MTDQKAGQVPFPMWSVSLTAPLFAWVAMALAVIALTVLAVA